MNIVLGTHPDSRSLLNEVKKPPFLISIGAEHVFREFEVSQEKKRISLRKVALEQFFKGKVTLERFYVEVTERCGVSLCTLEALLQLRRQYVEQPNGESLRLAVQPIWDEAHEIYYPIARVSHLDDALQIKMDMYHSTTILDPSKECPFHFMTPLLDV